MTSAPRTEFRLGWRNLLAATIGLGFGVAGYTPIASLFFHALEAQFGWSKAAAAGALVALPLTAIALPFAGWLIDRVGVRMTSGFSVCAAALSFLWLSKMNGEIREYYVAIIALNVLGCATGPVAYTRLVAAQFKAARGSALAVAQFGIAFMAVLLPPILGTVMSTAGWRGAYLFLACWTLVGGLVAQLLMQVAEERRSDIGTSGSQVRTAVATPSFWILGGAVLAVCVAVLGFVAQFQSILLDKGIPPRTTQWLLSVLGVSTMLSRLLVGRLFDLGRPTLVAAAVTAVASVGTALLMAGPAGMPATVVAILLIGFGIGAELDFMSFFCARFFGLRHYAAIYGLLSMFFYCGYAIGGIGYGAIRDETGSYEGALAVATLLLLVASLLFLLLRRSEQSQGAAELPEVDSKNDQPSAVSRAIRA